MISQLETLALKSVALKDSEYFYRKVCRYYSEKFHTPLTDVYNLTWPFIFTNYLEHIIETNNSQESLYGLVIDICYPEKSIDEEKEIKSWIERIEIEEENKRQAKKQLKQKVIVDEPEVNVEPEINMESSSFIHLDEEMEDEDEY